MTRTPTAGQAHIAAENIVAYLHGFTAGGGTEHIGRESVLRLKSWAATIRRHAEHTGHPEIVNLCSAFTREVVGMRKRLAQVHAAALRAAVHETNGTSTATLDPSSLAEDSTEERS